MRWNVLLVLGACGRIGFAPIDDGRGDDARGDALVVASDDFNRASGPNLGTNWVLIGGTFGTHAGIAGNEAVCCPSNGASPSGELWAAPIQPDQFSQVTVIGTSDVWFGAAVRGSTSLATLYFCGTDANDFVDQHLRIVRWIAHNGVELALAGSTLAPNDVVRLEIVGTHLRCLVDGAVALTADDAMIASGRAGFLLQSNTPGGAAIDDWSGGAQ